MATDDAWKRYANEPEALEAIGLLNFREAARRHDPVFTAWASRQAGEIYARVIELQQR